MTSRRNINGGKIVTIFRFFCEGDKESLVIKHLVVLIRTDKRSTAYLRRFAT
ncbi:hypothetical protein DsansV1_C03g0026191 [Dioscorea sansibarensis]